MSIGHGVAALLALLALVPGSSGPVARDVPAPLPYSAGLTATAAPTPIYQDFHFARKSVCVETSIRNSPLAAVATMFRAAGFRVYVRFSTGGCAAAGFTAGQRVNFAPYSVEDKKNVPLAGACAFTAPANTGHLTGVHIRLNYRTDWSSYKSQYCRVDHQTGVWAHELAHAFGLAHRPSSEVSVMGGEDAVSALDRARLVTLYKGHPF